MERRQSRARAVAAVGGALAVFTGVVGLVWHLVNTGVPYADGISDWWAMGVVASLSFGPTGVALARARPDLPLGWLFLAVGMISGVSLVATEYGLWGLQHGHSSADNALWWGNWLWVVGLVPIASLVPLLVPDGRLPSPRWRPALVLGVAAPLAAGLTFAVGPYSSTTPGLVTAGLHNPVSVPWMDEPAVSALLTLVIVAGAITGVAGLVVRWRRSEGVERQQLKWVLLGIGSALLLFALGFVFGPSFSALAMAPLPVAVVIAAQRHGLADVDVVISRSLVYVGLSGLVIGMYVVLVWLVSDLLDGVIEGDGAAPLVATAVVALAILPLRDVVQRRVNRLVHGDAQEPYVVLDRLGDRLAAAATPTEITAHVLPSVAEQVTRSMRAELTTLTLDDGSVASSGGAARAALPEDGAPTPGSRDTLTVDLLYAGEHLGTLAVTRPGGFDRRATRALARLASQAGVAVHTVFLARETQRAREAAVLAREEERRRLRRDLHDGVGPSLAALALQIETARNLTLADPGAATQLLDRLTPRLNAAVAEVRALVNELRPPMLDELGLAAAVHELGDRFTTATARVVTHVDDLPELPAAVEVAAYQIAGEATANATRHAGASRVDVRLTVQDGMIRVQVADDGAGMATGAPPGVGLASMDERARELGGRLCIDSGAGGTTVTALLPKEPT